MKTIPCSLRAALLFLCLIWAPAIAPTLGQQPPRADTDRAATALSTGLRAYRAGKLDGALASIREAHRLSPNDPQVRLYLGMFLYEKAPDSVEARQLMEGVLDSFPSNTDLALRLLDCHLRARDENKTDALLERLRQRMAEDSRFAFNVLYTLVRHGYSSAARDGLNRVARGLQGEVAFISGLIEFGAQNREEALRHLQNAAKSGFPPEGSRQLLTLADCFYDLRDFPQAARAYESYLRHNPRAPAPVRFKLGLSLYGYGDFQKAVERLTELRTSAPELPEVDFYIGSALIELKRPDESRSWFESELKRDPKSHKALCKLAYLDYLSGDNESCRRRLAEARRINPDWFESHFVAGLLHYRMGEFAEAVRSLEACLREEPEFPKAHYQLSQAYSRLGDREKARQYLESFNRLQDALTSRAMEAQGLSNKPPEKPATPPF